MNAEFEKYLKICNDLIAKIKENLKEIKKKLEYAKEKINK